MSKPKVYEYQGRTFEVKVYNEAYGLISIYVNEVIRPNRKFFGRTKFFISKYRDIDQYASIDEAVRNVIAKGLEQEIHRKAVNEKWEEWNK